MTFGLHPGRITSASVKHESLIISVPLTYYQTEDSRPAAGQLHVTERNANLLSTVSLQQPTDAMQLQTAPNVQL